MKKELAEYLATRRAIETIMFDEGDRLMYDLSHLSETLDRWVNYKEGKKKSATKMSEITKMVDDLGKTTVEKIDEDEDKEKKKEATDEEVLDIGFKTRTILEEKVDSPFVKVLLKIPDGPTTYAHELDEEVNQLKQMVLPTIMSKLFDIIFLS